MAADGSGQDRIKVFMSYCFDNERFVSKVNDLLSKQPRLDPYCYVHRRRAGRFREHLLEAIASSSKFVVFAGERWGKTQKWEIKTIQDKKKTDGIIVVKLHSGADLRPVHLTGYDPIKVSDLTERSQVDCARRIANCLQLPFSLYDIPLSYPFEYEKDITEEYIGGQGIPSMEKLTEGCPESWPGLDPKKATLPNPVPPAIIGGFRPLKARIIVDARGKYHHQDLGPSRCCLDLKKLVFPEAGPRAKLRYPLPGAQLKAGVLVSGGIAPGINAVITGIVERHHLYKDWQDKKRESSNNAETRRRYPEYGVGVLGYRDGFSGLLRNDTVELTQDYVRGHANQGGSMIGTSRCPSLALTTRPEDRQAALTSVVNKLIGDQIDVLYVIGGDGSMRAAHAIWTLAKEMHDDKKVNQEISVVAIPKTMDNDILWVWQSFGFMSAVEKAREFVLQLHTEAKSNPRLCIVQLFGSDSGFVVTHAALASGVCDLVLIPEVDFTIKGIARYVCDKLSDRYLARKKGVHRQDGESLYGMILVGETTIPKDVAGYIDKREIGLDEHEMKAVRAFVHGGRRVQGQTPDELRTGGLKIISRALQVAIKKMGRRDPFWKDFRVFTNEPRHLIRAISPSVQDVIFGHRLGSLAVDNAMAGYTDFMISQWMTEYVLVPLKLVVLGRKRVPRDGIFWKSVVANTGQPADLTK